MKKVKLKEARGITLVALVITVIILLILAGVALSLVIGENGLIKKSKEGVGVYKGKAEEETIQLESFNEEFGKMLPGVSVLQIFDKNGKNESDTGYDPNKLHIGDFVNYDAGTWKEEEINNIRTGIKDEEVPVNNSNDYGRTNFQFGNFWTGMSRNETAKNKGKYEPYLKDENEKEITGWRVFDVLDDGTMVLISAGGPENYYHAYVNDDANNAYKSEYILTGTINKNATSLNLEEKYTKRNWENYVDKKQKAISATVLTKEKLDEWYSKYFIENANTATMSTFQLVYDTKYQTLVDYNAQYWLATTRGRWLYCIVPSLNCISDASNNASPVRVLVTLDKDVKLSGKIVGKQIVKNPENEEETFTYNIWNIKK